MTYAQQLKAIREDMLETQQQFAERIGITQGNLSQLESAARLPSRRRHNETIIQLTGEADDAMLESLNDEFEAAVKEKAKSKGKTIARIQLTPSLTALRVVGKRIDKEFVIRYTDLLDVAEMKRVIGLFNELIARVAL